MKNISQNRFSLTLNIVFTVLLILVLSQYLVVYGQNIPWAKHPDNPVLDVGPPGNWDGVAVGNPCVIFENDTFKMWHVGFDGNRTRIGYATSLDGATWTKDTVNSPVLDVGAPGEWDGEMINWPSVVFVNGTYHMWYVGFSNSTVCDIGHATSPDGLLWTKDPDNPVLEQGPAGSWDSELVNTPFIIFENDTFHLWYGGEAGTSVEQIGYATATNPDGKNWTKSGNPVLSPTSGTWDYPRVSCPSIATYNDKMYMFYSGGTFEQHDIGFATSTDKVTWYKDPDPCLVRGPAGSWDDYDVFASYVIYDGNEYKMWYRGESSSTGEIKIGLATTFTLSPDTLNVPSDYPTIQTAIDSANNGDIVLVQPGIYIENINYIGKNITVASLFFTTQDTAYISQTIIDGNQSGSVVVFDSGEDSTAVLTGFTLRKGSAFQGGGIYCIYSSPSLENVKITGNSATYGGGIYCGANSYQPLFPNLVNVTITDNYADRGGGILFDTYDRKLFNVPISNNNGDCGGDENPILVNVIIADNFAGSFGGGIYCQTTSPLLINNTITGNSAAANGGGIYCFDRGNPILKNCILWGDSLVEVYFSTSTNPNTITISYSDIQGGEAGIVTNGNGTVNWLEGNINEDPLFADGDLPFTLSSGSPCIDAGNPDTVYNDPEDPNNPGFALWPAMGTVRNDMGAYGGPNTIYWIVTAVEDDENEGLQQPTEFSLSQNYPNPFNPSTTIQYSIKEGSSVELILYDILGRQVEVLVNEEQDAGEYKINLNAGGLASGIYFYRIQAGSFVETKKMILLK